MAEIGLGQLIKELRLRRGLSQNKLAQLIGVQRSYISELESGRRKGISLDTARKLARALGVKPGLFFGETEAMPPPRPRSAIRAELEATEPVEIPIIGSFHEGSFHERAVREAVQEYAYWASTKAAKRNIKGLVARGFCLSPVINEGDIAFVDVDLSPQNGDIVIASIGDKVMAKRFRETSKRRWLESNDETIDAGDCVIHGVVIEVSKRLR
jgi:transcriptional regulator with XRE-family HTH domain